MSGLVCLGRLVACQTCRCGGSHIGMAVWMRNWVDMWCERLSLLKYNWFGCGCPCLQLLSPFVCGRQNLEFSCHPSGLLWQVSTNRLHRFLFPSEVRSSLKASSKFSVFLVWKRFLLEQKAAAASTSCLPQLLPGVYSNLCYSLTARGLWFQTSRIPAFSC